MSTRQLADNSVNVRPSSLSASLKKNFLTFFYVQQLNAVRACARARVCARERVRSPVGRCVTGAMAPPSRDTTPRACRCISQITSRTHRLPSLPQALHPPPPPPPDTGFTHEMTIRLSSVAVLLNGQNFDTIWNPEVYTYGGQASTYRKDTVCVWVPICAVNKCRGVSMLDCWSVCSLSHCLRGRTNIANLML